MANRNTVSKSWTRIEAWLQKKAKRIHKRLGPGAPAAELAAFQKQTGVPLPADVAQSWRIHNGADESDLFPSSEYDDMGYSLLSLDEISNERRTLKRLKRNWLPLATNGGGDYQCVDLKTGNVIEVNHETNEVKTLADSWAERLADLADGLETDRYKYDADSGIVAVEPPPPPGQFKSITTARKCIAAGAAGEEYDTRPDRLTPAYAPAVKAVNRLKLPMREAPFSRQQAASSLNVGRNDVLIYLEHFEPEREFEHKGLRFYPLPRVIDLNEPHYCEYPKRFPVVIATTADGGRLCLDMARNEEQPPVVLYPADVDLKGKTKKQLETKGKVLAANLPEFLLMLTSNGPLDLSA